MLTFIVWTVGIGLTLFLLSLMIGLGVNLWLYKDTVKDALLVTAACVVLVIPPMLIMASIVLTLWVSLVAIFNVH